MSTTSVLLWKKEPRKQNDYLNFQKDVYCTPSCLANREELTDLITQDGSSTPGTDASHHVGFSSKRWDYLAPRLPGHCHHSSPVCAADGG